MADRTGQRLGNYRVMRFLGHGAFAEVYLGEHLYLKSPAALKVLLASLKGEDVERFVVEAQTLVRLRHQHIVRVLEFAVEQETPVLFMDYAAGGTLRDRHPRGSRLSVATTVTYVKQIASALQYAHNHNIIHRDVKPENILLGSDQQILLSDFGLALLAASPDLLSTQELAGTIPYIAPEQLRGKASFASDQYSLGVITYEWLCGVRPFEGNRWEIIHQHISATPPPLREKRPELPITLEAVVLRALAKDPLQRFVSVQAFALALERASQASRVDLAEDPQLTRALPDIADASLITPLEHSDANTPLSPTRQAPRRVFLSAAPADEDLVARLQNDLATRGIHIENDSQGNTLPILEQGNVVREGIRTAEAVLLVVSANTRSSRTVQEHLQIADMYQRRLIFVWVAGNDIADVLPEVWGKTAVIDLIDARETHYESALDEIIACLEEDTAITATLDPVLAGAPGEPRNPYKGLRAFTKKDAADFFGRDALIQELAETMNEMLSTEQPGPSETRLLTVIGPSGSGKSSAVMAGLLPHLQQGVLPDSEQWVYLDPMVPGEHPIEALTLALSARFPTRSLKSIREDLRDDTARGLHWLATSLTQRSGAKVMLLIDQFEELFTRTTSEAERRHFIDLLVSATTAPHGPVFVILTLRADCYDRPMAYPALSRIMQRHLVQVLPMEIKDLRAVIEKPAAERDVQLAFEGNLVGDLLFEVHGQGGALPLLQFTLDQLFQRRNGHRLTRRAYQEIGGVKGALANQAETTYGLLPSEEHQRLARALFLRLIDPGATEQDTRRRRAALAELSLPDAKQTALIRAVAEAFVAARLLTTNEVAGTTTIEVSHEALIREWPRLSEWLREAREDIILQQAVSTDAAEWVRREKPVDRVYRGAQLLEAQAWAKRNVPSTDEVTFLQAGVAERKYQEQAELNQRLRELALQRRVVNRQRWLITALSIFSMVVIVLASLAEVNFLNAQAQQKKVQMETQIAKAQATIASTQAQLARADALATEANFALSQNKLDQALLLSVEATQTNTLETRSSLLSALEQSPQIVTMLRSGFPLPLLTLVFGSDGHTLISSDGSSLYIWNTQTKQGHPLQLDNQTYFGSVALSSDNRTLATSSGDGIWLWDIQTGTQLAPLKGGINSNAPATLVPRTSIAFSSSGRFVASGRCIFYSFSGSIPLCIRTQISVWDVSSNPPHPIGSFVVLADVKSIAFSPDGETLAVGSDMGVQLWNVATSLGSPLTTNAGANSVAFSPGGTLLAAGNEDGTIQVWNVASGQLVGPPAVLLGHTGPITNVAFSPDSQSHLLASSSEDRTVRVWNVASSTTILTLNGDSQRKWSVAFTSDGKTLASGSDDGTIILWNITAQSALSKLLTDLGGLNSPVFSADGTMIFTGSTDGKIFLQNVKTGHLVQMLDTTIYRTLTPTGKAYGNPYSITSLALSKDRSILASGRLDGSIILWDTKTGNVLAHFGKPNLLYKIVLSLNGQILASSGEGDMVTLWNAVKGTVLHTLPYHTNRPFSKLPIALSPDGKVLAVGDCGKMNADGSCEQEQVQLWDTATGKVRGQPLLGHQSTVQGVAFSADGHTLASSSRDAIILWDVTKQKPTSRRLPLLSNASTYYSNVLFSPDGQVLVLTSAVGSPFSFVLWDLAQNELFAPAISQEGAVSLGSIAFSPDGAQLVSVTVQTSPPHSGVFTLWDVSLRLWQERACTIANRNLTQDEWKHFISYQPYGKVCPNLAA